MSRYVMERETSPSIGWFSKSVVDEEYPKGYFNLRPHLNDETTIMVNGKKKTIGSMVHAGLRKDFQDRYSDNKFKFKRRHFTKQPTVKDARDNKPSGYGDDLDVDGDGSGSLDGDGSGSLDGDSDDDSNDASDEE
ncbi:hypothetical protein Tco_1510065 [Tanacetum coccineum]